MSVLRDARDATSYRVLGDYIQDWVWPKHITTPSSSRLFSKEASRSNLKAKHFSSGASELLSLLPVLGHYFLLLPVPRGEHVECFMALLDVAQLVFAAGECKVCPVMLETLITRHLEMFIRVYGEDKVLPKHNYCLMLPRQLHRFGTFLSCFVHERHHMLVKKMRTIV